MSNNKKKNIILKQVLIVLFFSMMTSTTVYAKKYRLLGDSFNVNFGSLVASFLIKSPGDIDKHFTALEVTGTLISASAICVNPQGMFANGEAFFNDVIEVSGGEPTSEGSDIGDKGISLITVTIPTEVVLDFVDCNRLWTAEEEVVTEVDFDVLWHPCTGEDDGTPCRDDEGNLLIDRDVILTDAHFSCSADPEDILRDDSGVVIAESVDYFCEETT